MNIRYPIYEGVYRILTSFRRENELIEKIKVVKLQLSQMRTVNTLAGQ